MRDCWGLKQYPADVRDRLLRASDAGLARAEAASRVGVAVTDRHPRGTTEVDGRRIDVVTEGDYRRAGYPLEVVDDEGYRRGMRRFVHSLTPDS